MYSLAIPRHSGVTGVHGNQQETGQQLVDLPGRGQHLLTGRSYSHYELSLLRYRCKCDLGTHTILTPCPSNTADNGTSCDPNSLVIWVPSHGPWSYGQYRGEKHCSADV